MLIGFELTLTHWFYLYIPWFFPFVAFVVLAARRRRAETFPAHDDAERSSSRPAETSFAFAATLVACTLFLVGWGVLHRGFFTHDRIIDTPVYESYGSAIDSGQVPYRDFALEYPPGALPVFALPALAARTETRFAVGSSSRWRSSAR